MWMGWNHPPALFCSSQVSTAFRAGLAITLVNPEASTSAQVMPLIVHSPFWRSKASFRVFGLSAGGSFMAGATGKVAGQRVVGRVGGFGGDLEGHHLVGVGEGDVV